MQFIVSNLSIITPNIYKKIPKNGFLDPPHPLIKDCKWPKNDFWPQRPIPQSSPHRGRSIITGIIR